MAGDIAGVIVNAQAITAKVIPATRFLTALAIRFPLNTGPAPTRTTATLCYSHLLYAPAACPAAGGYIISN